MIAQDTATATPEDMARMFALLHSSERVWQDTELGTLLQRQLDANLVTDLSQGDPILMIHINEILHTTHLQPATFRALLVNPQPPLKILEQAKRWLKTLRQEAAGLFAEEVATVLYYAVIAAARVRLNAKISALSDAALVSGCQWGLKQSWIDPTIRQLLETSISRISLVPARD